MFCFVSDGLLPTEMHRVSGLVIILLVFYLKLLFYYVALEL